MFEALVQQATDGILNNIVSIVVSLSVVLPIVAGLAAKIYPKLKATSQYTDTFGQKMAEYADDFYLLADVVNKTAPEAVKALETRTGKDVAYFKTRADTAKQQALRFKNRLDPEYKASAVEDLPREDARTTNIINRS